MKGSWRTIAFTAAWVLLGGISIASFAQMHRGGGMGMHMYNPATEVTVKGSIEAVHQIPGPGGMGGTHLTLKAEKESFDVHVGPSWYLAEKKISFAQGDQVQVIGSQVKFGEQTGLIAREIKKGNETFTLRNAQGIPVWSGGHHRGVS